MSLSCLVCVHIVVYKTFLVDKLLKYCWSGDTWLKMDPFTEVSKLRRCLTLTVIPT